MLLSDPVASRVILNIEVPNDRVADLKRISIRTGIKQRDMARRIWRWFFAQEDVVKAAVLGNQLDKMAVDVARLALEKMAADALERINQPSGGLIEEGDDGTPQESNQPGHGRKRRH